MSFRVEFSHQAAKELKRLDRTTIKRIETRTDELAQDPFNPRISQQKEMDPDSRKSRVGDWRIIFQVDEERKIVNIAAISGPTDSGQGEIEGSMFYWLTAAAAGGFLAGVGLVLWARADCLRKMQRLINLHRRLCPGHLRKQ